MEFAGAIGRAFNLDEIASSIAFGQRLGDAIYGVHRLVKIANQMQQPSQVVGFFFVSLVRLELHDQNLHHSHSIHLRRFRKLWGRRAVANPQRVVDEMPASVQ